MASGSASVSGSTLALARAAFFFPRVRRAGGLGWTRVPPLAPEDPVHDLRLRLALVRQLVRPADVLEFLAAQRPEDRLVAGPLVARQRLDELVLAAAGGHIELPPLPQLDEPDPGEHLESITLFDLGHEGWSRIAHPGPPPTGERPAGGLRRTLGEGRQARGRGWPEGTAADGCVAVPTCGTMGGWPRDPVTFVSSSATAASPTSTAYT